MYVEKLTPQSVTQEHPIVFIAGVAQTGTNFLENRMAGQDGHLYS
jgi:hypothetical protein